MTRLIIFLLGMEIAGGWLMGSLLGFELPLAFGLVAIILAMVVAGFILLMVWSHSD